MGARKRAGFVDQNEQRKPVTGQESPRAEQPEPRRSDTALSDYEDLQRHSRQLQREHEAGGPGTSQPPDQTTPLLHPKPPKKTDQQ
jgi:hypothetical protein